MTQWEDLCPLSKMKPAASASSVPKMHFCHNQVIILATLKSNSSSTNKQSFFPPTSLTFHWHLFHIIIYTRINQKWEVQWGLSQNFTCCPAFIKSKHLKGSYLFNICYEHSLDHTDLQKGKMQPPLPTAEESHAMNCGGTENRITHLPAIILF